MMTITNFLKDFRLPPRLVRELPSTKFEDGLNDWVQTRQHEIEDPLSPSYDYYARSYREHTRASWGQHDGAMLAQEAEFSGGLWGATFADLGSDPGFVLGAVARQLGWRIVPIGRMAAHRMGNPAVAHEVEAACRAWVDSADATWKHIARCPHTRANLASAREQVRPLRNEAEELARRVLAVLTPCLDR